MAFRQNDLCEACGKRPRFVENGFMHPYCSRGCARNIGENPTACLFAGCNASGRPALGGFCSVVHHRDATRWGLTKGNNTNAPQVRDNSGSVPTQHSQQLSEVDPNSPVFKSVESCFLQEWSPKNARLRLRRLYEIRVHRDARTRQDAYRKGLGEASPIKQIRTFHASQCICDLGMGKATPCNLQACGICKIVQSSFRRFEFNSTHNEGRFGPGIYSYENPALADKFATSCTSSQYRVMIASDVFLKQDRTLSESEPVFVTVAEAMVPLMVLLYTK